MSLRTVERAIWAEAKGVFNNPKLRLKDIREWSTSENAVKKNLGDDEVVASCPKMGVWVIVGKEHDKR